MLRAVAVAIALTSAAGGSRPQELPATLSNDWVPFSATLKISRPGRSDSSGRFFRDQHGCERQEMQTGPGETLIVTIKNFETGRFYRLMLEQWSSQQMRIGPQGNAPRARGPVGRSAEKREGFDVFPVRVTMDRRDGTRTVRRSVVAPQLNHFAIEQEFPPDGVLTAHSIELGPPDPALFRPPAGVQMNEEPGYGGYMMFSAVEFRIAFPGAPAIQAVATEERLTRSRHPRDNRSLLCSRRPTDSRIAS